MYSKINGSQPPILSRNNSLCPTPEELLLKYVLANNVEEIEKIVNEKLLTHKYAEYGGKPILLVACIEENVQAKTITTLIKEGADLRYSDEAQWEALHFAAKRSDLSVLTAVIDGIKSRYDINKVLCNSSNALHILIRYGNSEHKDFIDCAKLLIEEGIDVNLGDNKSVSPILWAAKKGLKDIIKVIIELRPDVDLDTHLSRNLSARNIIVKDKLYDGSLPNKVHNNNENTMLLVDGDMKREIDVLFNYLKSDMDSDFIKYKNGNIENLVNGDNISYTLLQMACDKGKTDIVKFLLEKGADRFKTTEKNKQTPLEIAADHGFYEIFKILLDLPNLNFKVPNRVLVSLLRNYDCNEFNGINTKKCFNYLFEKVEKKELTININEVDEWENSPLHYAVRYGDQNVKSKLLGLGASLGSKNVFGIMPVNDIEPEVLEQHLDNCVQFDFKEKKDKEGFCITFNYSTLIPPKKEVQKIDPESGEKCTESRHETEVIHYMSIAPEFKHLLKHPVIVSFLFMKWHKIKWIFYTNLAVYVAFFVSLLAYIFSYYANFVPELSSLELFFKRISWPLLLITFFILVFRELFQIIILPKKYFINFENYVEILLLILSGFILFDSASVIDRKQLSALSILFSAFELILMVGQHPKLSTNVVMLRTVSYNFFKFLLWYSLLLIAFALSFNILFSEIPTATNVTITDDAEEDDSFSSPGKSVFKTIVMLTGEFEASDIKFSTFPIVSKFIFVLFIFMIAIILLNLLNGLAVSDTQMIKNDAELFGHIARAQHIRYVELMLMGNILPQNIINKIRDLCCCCNIQENCNYSLFKSFGERISLLPNLDKQELKIYPNRNGLIVVPNKNNQKRCCNGCTINLDKETIKRTDEIVKRKREEKENQTDSENVDNELSKIKFTVEELKDTLDKLARKLGI